MLRGGGGKSMPQELSALQSDALREMGNIGSGHAATALSKLLNETVMVDIPRVKILSEADISRELTLKDDQIMVGVFQKIYGRVNGSILITIQRDHAFKLVDIMASRSKGETKFLGLMEVSILEEVGNILTGSYLTALSNLTGLVLLPSVPTAVVDVLSSLIDRAVTASGSDQQASKAILVETGMSVLMLDLLGSVYLFPTADSLQVIFESLGLPEGM